VSPDPLEHVSQICERVDPVPLARGDEAGQHSGRASAIVASEERPVPAPHRHAPQTPLGAVMPTPGLCRVGIVQTFRFRRISDSDDSETRHNDRLSRKASSEFGGRKRSGTALDGVACARALGSSVESVGNWRAQGRG
jgi:hypothetical protein